MLQFTKRSCEQIGINFELRLVGEAREGLDGEGVGIDVEEAILEVSCAVLDRHSAECISQANDDRDVDGIMVYYPIYGGRQVRSNSLLEHQRSYCLADVVDRINTCNPSCHH